MEKLLNWIFKCLEYYSDVYENGINRIFSILVFAFATFLVDVFFAVYFYIYGAHQMALYDTVSAIVFLIAMYLILIKHKYLAAQYMIVVILCGYIICCTYYLGYSKNAFILFYPVLFAIYSVSPAKEKHLTAAAIIIGISFAILFFIRFNYIPIYGDRFAEIEYVNVSFVFTSIIYIFYNIHFYENLIHSIRDDNIDKLEEEANTDFLTGLNNMRYLEEHFYEEDVIDNSFIIIGDIDFFKKVNDSYGHIAGDYVLKELSNIMSSFFREDDILVRWGGEEFLVVVKGINSMSIAEKINRLSDTIRKYEFTYEDVTFNITMTFGIKKFDHNIPLIANIDKADEALYFGKESGRDVVVYYSIDGNYEIYKKR